MKPLELLRRAAGKSPGYLARRAALEARRAIGARRLRRRLEAETAELVARRAGAASLREVWEKSSARALGFTAPQRDALRSLYAGRFAPEGARLAEDFERVLAHTFDLLGSGPVALGPVIDWHLDFKSGLRFPSGVASQGIDYAQLDRPSDVKVPWELSRGQHLTRLGQAWVLARDERAPREFEAEVRAWIAANPPGTGVNWACTMDVALRAVSWVWALALFEGAPFSNGFEETILLSLHQHGVWIPGHLELAEVNGNHYLSDALGMIALGVAFDATPEGRGWSDAGARIFEEEILLQTTEDGAGIEGSVPYHRLVLEIFLVGRRLLDAAGRPLSREFDARLARMFEFVEAYVTPEGLSPVVGDADDGRALVLGREDVRDHRALLSTGAVLFGRGSFRARATKLHEDSLWLLGPEAASAWDALPDDEPSGTCGFPDAGFFVLRSATQYVFVDAGPVGFKGRGGHGHNDCLSFEWHAFGRPLLTDSGAYVYTASPEWRNRFRSTAFHNTIRVDGEEINRFPSALALWSLKNDAVPFGVALERGAEEDELVSAHTGYRRLADPVIVTRTFRFDRRDARLSLRDRIAGAGSHRVEFFFHAAPGGAGRLDGFDLAISFEGGPAVRLSPRSRTPLAWEKREGWFSPSYGIRIPRETWIAVLSAPVPAEVDWELVAVA
ncbi:MAG TPA: alginate lyase family protein [Thermoanaerobaculia bacterium]|nr:alginate lyase family protein [Thermoanaerobaculia bacterium]